MLVAVRILIPGRFNNKVNIQKNILPYTNNVPVI